MSRTLTREQIREVDRIAIEELGIPGVVLMENAGRNAAERVADRVRTSRAKRVVIFCGPGNNGGDGFVIARQLANAGIEVRVYLAGDPERLSPDCAVNHDIACKMGIGIELIDSGSSAERAAAGLSPEDVVVDALLGTGFGGEVREPTATLIHSLNEATKAATVAVDVPSGLDCNTGRPANATVKADLTVTFVAAKVGFTRPEAQPYVGQIFACGIGAPPTLIDRVTGRP
jgi:NAD(P)H-hydrate epimerase